MLRFILHLLSVNINFQAFYQNREHVHHKGAVRAHKNLLFLWVLIWQFVDMDKEPRYRPQIVCIVFLRISIDNGSKEFKMIKNLWKNIDQGTHLIDLLAETLNDHILALYLAGSTGAIVARLIDAHISCLAHHILKCIVGGLRQEDVVVQEFWSDLSQQGNQESLDGSFSEVGVVNGVRFLEPKQFEDFIDCEVFQLVQGDVLV